ncbi:hypothetical protein KSP39_PZI004405 [Platanthera zijinensis]|uniref:Uncharacterized protein n=1 Tax=Platanthera zijinensis TaxID=2320716 RepID=A0AAP0BVT0_9ASPA
MSPRRWLRSPMLSALHDPVDHKRQPIHGVWALSGPPVVPLPFPTDHQDSSAMLTDIIQPNPTRLSLVRRKDGSWHRTTQSSYLIAATTFGGTLARRRSLLLSLPVWSPKLRGCPRLTSTATPSTTSLGTRHIF